MLSNTAHVILGFLQNEPMSGYEIKRRIDLSTRFFFAASYGQIYPELKRLEERGFVTGKAKSRGQRARTEYELTESGREVLTEWLRSPGASVETRDEGLLKLFFMESLTTKEKVARLEEMKAERAGSLNRLREIDTEVSDHIDPMPKLSLDYGIASHESAIEFYERAIKELTSKSPTPNRRR
ncbi:MAG TPA: PadR family transcriptional regulator [Solirubrobacterales bacterium]|nr:PadR family transcriptional regulator [Solirubrobacterales bacterium]